MKLLKSKNLIISAIILMVIVLVGATYMLSTAPKEYVYSGDLTSGQTYDASSYVPNITDPRLAFDDYLISTWSASNAENNQWISVEFDEPKHIGQLNMDFSIGVGNPRNFKLQGYKYGNWNDVYTGVCEDSLSRWHKFEFENKKDYSQYRVLVLDTYPVGGVSTISIAEIKMMEIDTEYNVFGKIWTLDGKRT